MELKMTGKEQTFYILGCTQSVAMKMSKEINVPVEQCRDFLLNQVIKYLKTKSQDISMSDLAKYGIIGNV